MSLVEGGARPEEEQPRPRVSGKDGEFVLCRPEWGVRQRQEALTEFRRKRALRTVQILLELLQHHSGSSLLSNSGRYTREEHGHGVLVDQRLGC